MDGIPAMVYLVDADMNVIFQNFESMKTYGMLKRLPFDVPHSRNYFVTKTRDLHQSVSEGSNMLIDNTSSKTLVRDILIERMNSSSCDVYRKQHLVIISESIDGMNMVLQIDISRITVQLDSLVELTTDYVHLLQHVYPKSYLKQSHSNPVDLSIVHRNAVVMFVDIVNFTNMCRDVAPRKIFDVLTCLFGRFDDVLAEYIDIVKYEIVGDCYIVVGNIGHKDLLGYVDLLYNSNVPSNIHIERMVALSVNMYSIAVSMGLSIRAGMHRGQLISGVIGTHSPKFMLCGETVNIAARMQGNAEKGTLCVTSDVYNAMAEAEKAPWSHSVIDVKGYGATDTYSRTLADTCSLTLADTGSMTLAV